MPKEKIERKRRRRRKVILFFLAIFLCFLFLQVSGVYAQTPAFLNSIIRAINPPKPIVKSERTLPTDVQSVIENLAKQEIKQDQAEENLAADTDYEISSDASFIVSASEIVQLFAASPSDKAKVRLKRIDRKIQKLVTILENDKSDRAITKAVGLIKDIGKDSGRVVSDKKRTKRPRNIDTIN